MTREQVLRVIRDLSKQFGLTGIALDWNGREKNGRAGGWMIHLGPNVWRTVEQCLVHEFTHSLVIQRRHKHFGPLRSAAHHGPEFYQSLVAVAHAYFGNPRLYHWASEYQGIYKRALRDGFVTGPRQCNPIAVHGFVAAGARQQQEEVA